MKISLSNDLITAIPQFQLGVIYYHNITIDESPQMVKGRMLFFQETLYTDIVDLDISSIKEVQGWRAMFKQVGTNPSHYRPSSESLLKRIKKRQFLEPVHSAVDINNLFSLEYKIPLGLYDLDRLKGDLTIGIGSSTEQYEAINGREISLENKLISSDEQGPFGSPYVDSKRSIVTKKTKNALQLVYFLPQTTMEDAHRMILSIEKLFSQINGGESKK
ncbi:phenylalanine--tRNA ligase beta subunit-related protein [Bacillus carboniphilus]|uniref:Phenylalanine--tRNA ligase beta subunit-related protein n=1 Tax=Bacillus carboniphilus TaxID=86663 RepID=A0ABY9JW58_9BACI|nr:phenylalanine--tRNA ligase beta subunit-related protein [Bacillus carboniphilus]WLR42707.1 phenylalanine--tRNA ligase beta subunit-related protein [Bacillus carboniphilus]